MQENVWVLDSRRYLNVTHEIYYNSTIHSEMRIFSTRPIETDIVVILVEMAKTISAI